MVVIKVILKEHLKTYGQMTKLKRNFKQLANQKKHNKIKMNQVLHIKVQNAKEKVQISQVQKAQILVESVQLVVNEKINEKIKKKINARNLLLLQQLVALPQQKIRPAQLMSNQKHPILSHL